ncbi:hypothetical protein AZE42_09548 [Rhizopogon vesiculosus]|uniref:Uncharacterized protein n=1 Tax=Rhizopogon vesiculosus TaxID=180088 RepID=A0A1J8R7P5_9AGAM|nr:hypothetical protein AZE42_09548 [Rhizopogon vesiculosus]
MSLQELLLEIVKILDDESEHLLLVKSLHKQQLKPTQGNSTKLIRKESEDDMTQVHAQRAAPSGGLANTSNDLEHDREHDGAPPPKFKRQRHLTHNDDEDILPAPKSRRRVVYTVLDSDEDEHDSTPFPKPVKHQHPLLNYAEDGDDSEVTSIPKRRQLPSAAASDEERHGVASHLNSTSTRTGLGQATEQEQHRDDEDDLAPHPKPRKEVRKTA